MIVFDFDRVLFDTDAIIDFIDEHGLQDVERGEALEEALDKAGFEWKKFVLPGVVEYLATHPDCVIISSAYSRNRKDNNNLAQAELFQSIKIRRSGIGKLIEEERCHITGESKEMELKKYAREGAIIVDDEIEHLQVAEKLGYKTVWFRTKRNLKTSLEGKPYENEFLGDGTVDSFEKFVALEKEWQKAESVS